MAEEDERSGAAGCERERDREGIPPRRREPEPEGDEIWCFLAEEEMVVGDDEEVVAVTASIREGLWVRSCCFMLSLRVKALLQVGQRMFFSPVCFLPWRAAWPDVVKVSWHPYRTACGHGYFFLIALAAELVGVVTAGVEGPDGGITGVGMDCGGERGMAGSGLG